MSLGDDWIVSLSLVILLRHAIYPLLCCHYVNSDKH